MEVVGKWTQIVRQNQVQTAEEPTTRGDPRIRALTQALRRQKEVESQMLQELEEIEQEEQ